MVKFLIMIYFTTLFAWGDKGADKLLQQDCLHCHQINSIPSEVIYRRYLIKYSSKKVIKEKIFDYISNPSAKNSIMPSQFFLKFTMKDRSTLSNKVLQDRINNFVSYYDINQKLFVPKNN